jgi:hypothetical protein
MGFVVNPSSLRPLYFYIRPQTSSGTVTADALWALRFSGPHGGQMWPLTYGWLGRTPRLAVLRLLHHPVLLLVPFDRPISLVMALMLLLLLGGACRSPRRLALRVLDAPPGALDVQRALRILAARGSLLPVLASGSPLHHRGRRRRIGWHGPACWRPP